MQYKLIVSDFDNTLCNSEKIVSKRTKNAIARFTESGGLFVICTTRPYAGIAQIAKDLGLKDEIIANQGSSIRRLEGDEPVKLTRFTPEEASEITKFFDRRTQHLFIAGDFDVFAKKHDVFTDVAIIQTGYKIKVSSNIVDESSRTDAAQILAGGYFPQYVQRLYDSAAKEFGQKYNIVLCDRLLMNITPKGVSKGDAIKYVAGLHGIEKEQIISFGDSDGDEPMFEFSGAGIAMGNATKNLKAAADAVIGPADEDGLAKFIEDSILK